MTLGVGGRLLVIGFAVALQVAVATQASADAAAIAVFNRFNIFGTWSPRCKHPASGSNPRVVFEILEGQIVHRVLFGGVYTAISNTVGTAEAVDGRTFRFTVIQSGERLNIVTVRIIAGRLHILSSVTGAGLAVVDHGFDLTTGRPALTDEKCDAPIS